jgi:L-threonylcarbamoyladenylate synthase
MQNLKVMLLLEGELCVIPTDTVYGVCVALKKLEWVEKIFETKSRDSHKPPVLLISKLEQILEFKPLESIDLDQLKEIEKKFWLDPNTKNTVILPLSPNYLQQSFDLHRGTNQLAFRLVKRGFCFDLIEKVGALASSSANLQGQPIVTSLEIFKNSELKNRVSFFVDGGVLGSQPSSIFLFVSANRFDQIR